MDNQTALLLVIGWLEYDFDGFQAYLEENLEIESSEADCVLTVLEKLNSREEKNDTTKSNPNT